MISLGNLSRTGFDVGKKMQVKHAAETSLTLGVVFVRYMSRWHGNHQAICA